MEPLVRKYRDYASREKGRNQRGKTDSDTEENRALYKAFGQDLQVLRYRDPQCVYAYHHAPPLCSLVFLVCLIRSDEQKEESQGGWGGCPPKVVGKVNFLLLPPEDHHYSTTKGRKQQEEERRRKQR